MKYNISEGLHTSIVVCVHRLGTICIIQHQTVLANPCRLQACDVVQWKAASTNSSTHQAWNVRTDRKHHHRPTTNNIIQGQCSSGKRLHPMTTHINKATLVMDCCIFLELFISFSRQQVWTNRNSHGLCTLRCGHWV